MKRKGGPGSNKPVSLRRRERSCGRHREMSTELGHKLQKYSITEIMTRGSFE